MQITLDEAKTLLQYVIDNNNKLQEKGQFPVSVSLCGGAGLGKTSMVDNLAKELDYNYIKLNLSQISDPSDLVGWPCKEHYACKEGECCWIAAELINKYLKDGWDVTEETRMGYAIPMWLKSIDPNKGTILNLDDFTRCSPAIMQAVMEIICRQEYISWKLPKNTTIIMTENPDNGSYMVSGQDEALASRYMKYEVKWDVNSWARWAENAQIDGRAINFLLAYHHEIMAETAQKTHPVNARNFTMFANTISGIDNWENPENLALIQTIASGAFVDDKDDLVGSLFTSFIANKLDKLISPEDLLLKPWSSVKDKIKACVYDGDRYRPDVASILHTRLLNYSIYYFNQKGSKTDKVQDRLLELINAPKEEGGVMLFSEDFLFDIIKTLIKLFPARTNKFMLNKDILRQVL